MKTEYNVAGWKLQDLGNGKVLDWTTGIEGVILESSGWSWKDVAWEEN